MKSEPTPLACPKCKGSLRALYEFQHSWEPARLPRKLQCQDCDHSIILDRGKAPRQGTPTHKSASRTKFRNPRNAGKREARK